MVRSNKPEIKRIDDTSGNKFTQSKIDFFKYVDGAPNTQRMIAVDPEAELQNLGKKSPRKK